MKYYKLLLEHPTKLKQEGEKIGWHQITAEECFTTLADNYPYFKLKVFKQRLKEGVILISPVSWFIGIN